MNIAISFVDRNEYFTIRLPSTISFHTKHSTRQTRLYNLEYKEYLEKIPIYGSNKSIINFPFVAGDSFKSIANFVYDSEQMNNWQGKQVKKNDIIWIKSDFLGQFFSSRFNEITEPFIIIAHNSDYSTPGDLVRFLDDKRILAYFTVNKDRNHPKVFGIPIGIMNPIWKAGNGSRFREFMTDIPPFEDRFINIYLNFNPSTNNQRTKWFNHFKKFPYVWIPPKRTHSQYLSDLKRSKYVVSPPGNGLDCHRTWESILMGAIPIILSTSIDEVYQDAPVLVVDDYANVTPQMLETFKPPTWHRHRAFVHYWFELIKNQTIM